MDDISAIVTMPPYAAYLEDVLRHPSVSGIRLNTVMPLAEPTDDAIKRLKGLTQKHGKDLWVDLKARQLRVADYGVPPFTEITLTHRITVDTPVMAYFSDGKESATVLKVDGRKLIMQEGPRRVVGPGESVNIMHPSLAVDGYLTEKDKEYIAACVRHDVHHYMLSFVERKDDLSAVYVLDPKAVIMAKIESQRGLDYVQKEYAGKERLFTARGDLYVEVHRPHQILEATEDILGKDANAAVGSRILSSLSESLTPSCADLGDLDNLLRMGYRTVMLGDDVCMRRESVLSALNVIQAVAERYR
jgi:pyruvate kinase